MTNPFKLTLSLLYLCLYFVVVYVMGYLLGYVMWGLLGRRIVVKVGRY
jgi:hypothetical protein